MNDKINEFKTVITHSVLNLKSVVLCITDGDYGHFTGEITSLPIPLLEFCISELKFNSEICEKK